MFNTLTRYNCYTTHQCRRTTASSSLYAQYGNPTNNNNDSNNNDAPDFRQPNDRVSGIVWHGQNGNGIAPYGYENTGKQLRYGPIQVANLGSLLLLPIIRGRE